jgi:alkylation response protein AidB-like acyl-CoA dehydrogenase
VAVHLTYTPEQEELARELREYFAGLMTPRLRAGLESVDGEYGDPEAYKGVVRQLGRDGWLTLGWPVEYGGRGRSMMDQLIFMDEAATAGVPVPFLTINTVGPTIMRFGTAAQKEFYLPRIAAGELHFSIGYSEPEAGTDLGGTAHARGTRGRSVAHQRSEDVDELSNTPTMSGLPAAPTRRRRATRVCPSSSCPPPRAGFSWTPVKTVAGPSTSATLLPRCACALDCLVGKENEGWPLITNQLNHERVALTSSAPIRAALAEVREWAIKTGAIEHEWVRLNLARVHAKVSS